jgi:hypothetical protein
MLTGGFMQITEQAITGDEVSTSEVAPYAALVNFYRAFNKRNFALMQDNWLQNEEASMANPLGGIKRGWNEIKSVYEKIFLGEAKVYVEFYNYSIHVAEGMFVAVGRERGSLTIQDETVDLAIRTSRTYRMENGQWKQLHHHGSMDNAALLAQYQTTLLGK